MTCALYSPNEVLHLSKMSKFSKLSKLSKVVKVMSPVQSSAQCGASLLVAENADSSI